MKTAITGGIGSGKSHTCNLLRERGIEVYDCDSAAKRLMRESKELRQKLIEAIGEEAYDGDKPDKAVISRFLLANDRNTETINRIVHPAVAEDFLKSGIEWMECAILFESGFNKLVDEVVCVTAPWETRLSRIMQRDKITREQALEWMEKQMPQEETARRSSYCLCNDGEHDLDGQITEIIRHHNEGH